MKWDFPNSPWWQYVQSLERLDEDYKLKKDALRATLKEAQKRCKHSKTTYHPDASGNNDSYVECDNCGASI